MSQQKVSIILSPSTQLPKCDVQHVPVTISYNGEAKVDQYFTPNKVEEGFVFFSSHITLTDSGPGCS